METTIVGFHRDEADDWVAELACEHSQHVRHRPPWTLRAWVTTEEGRRSKLGAVIDCPLCDGLTLPSTAREYRRTPTFTEETLPAALRSEHRLKPGTWGRIVVEMGELEYHVRGRMQLLGPGRDGVVEPEVVHRVEPRGAVRLHVEFWR